MCIQRIPKALANIQGNSTFHYNSSLKQGDHEQAKIKTYSN